MVRNLIAAVLLVVVTLGGTLFALGKLEFVPAQAGPAELPAAPPSPPIFTELEPFTVSLRDSDGRRILYVGITLRVEDEASRKLLIEYMPEVRDRVLATLTQQATAQLQAVDGRDILARELLDRLAQPYRPQPEPPRISRVLFTAYVVQ